MSISLGEVVLPFTVCLQIAHSPFLVIEKCPTNDGTGEECGSWGTLLLLWTLSEGSEGHLARKHSMAPKEFGFCCGEQSHLWVEHSDVLSFYSGFSDCRRKKKAFLQFLVWVNFYFSANKICGKAISKVCQALSAWNLEFKMSEYWIEQNLTAFQRSEWVLQATISIFWCVSCYLFIFVADTLNISTQWT